jgi:hypothetical protein
MAPPMAINVTNSRRLAQERPAKSGDQRLWQMLIAKPEHEKLGARSAPSEEHSTAHLQIRIGVNPIGQAGYFEANFCYSSISRRKAQLLSF